MGTMYNKAHNGYLGKTPTKELQQFNVIDDRVRTIHKVKVHEFRVSESDDPDLYAAVPMMEWQESEKGSWVMQHAAEAPEWHRYMDPMAFGYSYMIVAKLWDKDHTFYQLKWGQNI